jgi:hypothetical protein
MNKTVKKLSALFMDVATMPYTFANLAFGIEENHTKALKKNHIALGAFYLAPALLGLVTTPALGIVTYSVIHGLSLGASIGIEIAERGAAQDLYPRTTELKKAEQKAPAL